ncbi:MAG: sensor histidine kinase [Chloroflexi bacterium]|nr:sensor histidine kinase [Chloroflexota bacterium]
MEALSRLLARYRELMLRVPIFNRVLIGNSAIIIIGAIAGTIFTRHLTLFGNVWLILLFSVSGILITLVVNYWIIRTALHPLNELGSALEQANGGQIVIPDSLKKYQDPNIHHLVTAIDLTLARLANRTSQLRAISERAINAQEEERVRIARSLHDDTAQSISMLIIHLERLGNLIPADAPDLARRVADIQKVATQLLENLRKVIWDLRPAILDDLGLVAAIRWFARSNLETEGVMVDFGTTGEMMRLPLHLETMLFRISQEAVSNIIRHADAKKVSIRLWIEQGNVWLEIQDDGCGFDIAKAVDGAVYRKQLGLLGIQERVSLAGGGMEVRSVEGAGTSLRVYVPFHFEDSTQSNEAASVPPNAPEAMVQP